MEEPSDAKPGLIDWLYEINAKIDDYNERRAKEPLDTPLQGYPLSSEEVARRVMQDVDLDGYKLSTTIQGLSLLKAGRYNTKAPNEYSERVIQFNWEAFYKKSPHLFRVFAEMLAEQYAYVLIDSRTGYTDISGICTALLPEKLVVVFTPNMQSVQGGLDLIRQATEYRKESADLRPLLVFPLVSRVEAAEPDLRNDWRFGKVDHGIIGYQPEFERVLGEVYQKKKIQLTHYFNEIQIQHIPRYAYGEAIAVLEEKSEDKFSLRRSYQLFATMLSESRVPWEWDIKEQHLDSITASATPAPAMPGKSTAAPAEKDIAGLGQTPK